MRLQQVAQQINSVNNMRDRNIRKSYTREINLNTRALRDKSKYTRKQKHKSKNYDN